MGVSSHTLRPQELEQDGSPFTEAGGRDQRVRGHIFTTAWCPVSRPEPKSSIGSYGMFQNVNSSDKPHIVGSLSPIHYMAFTVFMSIIYRMQ